MARAKKAKSPTGRPSKVNPDLADAMRGKGGKRPTVKAKPRKKPLTRAQKMDRGMSLSKP
jgi:hypothetical protein